MGERERGKGRGERDVPSEVGRYREWRERERSREREVVR